MDNNNIIVKEAMKPACGHRALIGAATAQNYKPVGGEVHTTKFECPACKQVQSARAAMAESTPIEASFKRAYKFHNGVTGLKMVACRCGYRKYQERTTTIAQHMTATHGGTCAAVKSDGTTCNNPAKEGTAFCGITAHQAQAGAEVKPY